MSPDTNVGRCVGDRKIPRAGSAWWRAGPPRRLALEPEVRLQVYPKTFQRVKSLGMITVIPIKTRLAQMIRFSPL